MNRNRKRPGDQIFLGVPLFFRLDQEVRFAGVEHVRLDELAKLRRHLRRLVEFIYFALLGRFHIGGHHDARVENIERRVIADGAESFKRLGRHRARNESPVNQNSERKM